MKVYLIHGVPETLYGNNKQYGTLKAGAQQKTTNISGTFLLFLRAAGSKGGNSKFSVCSLERKRKKGKKEILCFLCLIGMYVQSTFSFQVFCNLSTKGP